MQRRHLLVLLLVGAALLLAACSRNPDVREAYMGADGTTIELVVDTCNADLSSEVVESDTMVEVAVAARNDTTDDCQDLIVINLDEPLGDRDLVYGPTGDVLSVITVER